MGRPAASSQSPWPWPDRRASARCFVTLMRRPECSNICHRAAVRALYLFVSVGAALVGILAAVEGLWLTLAGAALTLLGVVLSWRHRLRQESPVHPSTD